MFARAAARRERDRDVARRGRRRSPGARTAPSGPMSFATPSGSPGRRRGRAPRGAGQPCGAARRSATRSIASVAEPPLPNASTRPPPSSDCADRRRRGHERRRRPRAASAPAASAISAAFSQHERADVGDAPASRSPLARQERVEERRRARPRAREPSQVLEEHVHELPQHVVEPSRRAPGARTGRPPGGSNSHSRPAEPIVRQPRHAPRRRRSPRRRALGAAPRQVARARRPRAGSARLPTITGWTNSTATWCASDQACGEPPTASSRPPATKRSASARHRRASGSASAAKKRSPASRRRASSSSTAARRATSDRHAATRSPGRDLRSQSRHCSTPSPVRALTSMLLDAGVDRVEVARGSGRGRSRGAAAGRSC